MMTPEEAAQIGDLRMKILANTQAGLPPETGIDPALLHKCIEVCRKDYTAAQSKSKASGVSSPTAKALPVDLNSLFTTKSSK